MEEEALQPGGSEETLLGRLFSYYGPAEGESKGKERTNTHTHAHTNSDLKLIESMASILLYCIMENELFISM